MQNNRNSGITNEGVKDSPEEGAPESKEKQQFSQSENNFFSNEVGAPIEQDEFDSPKVLLETLLKIVDFAFK